MAEEIDDNEPEMTTSDEDYEKFTFDGESREWSKP